MDKHPEFLREFSKQESQDERDALAQEIRERRRDFFESKYAKNEVLSETQNQVEIGQESIDQTLEKIRNLETRLEEISSSLPSKILNLIEYVKIRKRLKTSQTNLDELQTKQELATEQKINLTEELASLDLSVSMQQAKEAISNFYKSQERKWAQSEYSKDDVEKYFTPEHIASLSLSEYVALLKRFPCNMVTHVTRQGIRDHVGAVNHYAGVNKFWNGFKDVVQAGKLKSSFDIYISEELKEEEIINLLNLKNKTKEEAVRDVEYLAGEETQHHHGSMADRMSLHVATEQVADTHYGAETGNEIFFVYPSLLIASQYNFSGQLAKGGGGYHNNQWIFADSGLDINSGLVFIPKDVPVDRKNGSKYLLDENSEPIPNADQESELKFALATDTVSSQDYWEEYFALNPDKKPNKIVYYEGGDPTQALINWKNQNGFSKISHVPDLGFTENRIDLSNSDEVSKKAERVSRFKTLALRVIDDYYGGSF